MAIVRGSFAAEIFFLSWEVSYLFWGAQSPMLAEPYYSTLDKSLKELIFHSPLRLPKLHNSLKTFKVTQSPSIWICKSWGSQVEVSFSTKQQKEFGGFYHSPRFGEVYTTRIWRSQQLLFGIDYEAESLEPFVLKSVLMLNCGELDKW